MNQMDKLRKLFMLCKAGVFIEYNEHKLYNDTVAEFLIGQGEREYIEINVWDKMIELDTIIGIEFHPDAFVDSHSVFHYDLDLALDKCLEIVANLTSDLVNGSTEKVSLL
jgi:hypothetical protein